MIDSSQIFPYHAYVPCHPTPLKPQSGNIRPHRRYNDYARLVFHIIRENVVPWGAARSTNGTAALSACQADATSQHRQCRLAHLLANLGWVDFDLGSSPGWWAATVATYCPSKVVEHPKSKSSEPSPPGDGPPCTSPYILSLGIYFIGLGRRNGESRMDDRDRH